MKSLSRLISKIFVLTKMQLILPFLFAVTGKAEKEVDLEQYFQAKGTLHCTTKFCDYGKAEGAKEYAQNQVRNLSFNRLPIEFVFVIR